MDEDRWAARAILLLVGAFALALVVPAGAILLVASRIDFDLDLDIGPKGCDQDPPSGTDLHGFDAATGRERWHRRLHEHSSFVGFDRGTAVVLEDDGTLVGVDGWTGRRSWSYHSGAPPVVGEGIVLNVDDRGVARATDVRTGRARWMNSANSAIAPLAITSGIAVVRQGGQAVGLDAVTGGERWRAPIAPGAVADGGGLLFARESYDTLVALDAASGAKLWAFHGPRSTPTSLRSGCTTTLRSRLDR